MCFELKEQHSIYSQDSKLTLAELSPSWGALVSTEPQPQLFQSGGHKDEVAYPLYHRDCIDGVHSQLLLCHGADRELAGEEEAGPLGKLSY